MDTRVNHIFYENMKGDTSLQEKENFLTSLFGGIKYKQSDMRETWNRGIKHGIELGLHCASVEGQRIELEKNTTKPKHVEFLKKFYELADEYNCAVQYHPQLGLTIIDRNTFLD